jgi:hypothetical protein
MPNNSLLYQIFTDNKSWMQDLDLASHKIAGTPNLVAGVKHFRTEDSAHPNITAIVTIQS